MQTNPMLAVVLAVGAWAVGSSQGVERQVVKGHVPAATIRLQPMGRLPGSTNLNLAIGLPVRNPAGLQKLLQDLYDPTSPKYRQYLTPAQFTEQFGPSEADYQALIAFTQAHGLTVTAQHPNRLVLDVRGTVTNIESMLHVTLRTYQHPTEARVFYAPNAEPSLDLAIPLLHISGLDNYSLPHPNHVIMPQMRPLDVAPNTGSGPNGAYMGNDFRAAYVPDSTLTGVGQSVGLLEFDGYHASDITYYETLAGLPNITLTKVLINGADGEPSPIRIADSGAIEVCLDIEMVASLAPGVSNIIVYIAPNSDWGQSSWLDMLSRMANDNQAKQLSCSWGGGMVDASAAEAIFQQMAAQGQSFFTASGDEDAFTGAISFPSESPNITQVGGTTLTTDGPGGPYLSETAWNRNNGYGSGGGISSNYMIPAWQKGVNMAAAHGSSKMRNVPDVALTAEHVYVRVQDDDYRVGGTSCAAPLWAAFTALMNQQNGGTSVGFLNPALYALGQSANYATSMHDITVGDNYSPSSPTNFPAVAGYDLCTGWGTPNGNNLIYTLTEPMQIAPATGAIFTGPVHGPFKPAAQNYSVSNAATNTLNWRLANPATWLIATPTSGSIAAGGPAAVVTLSLPAAASNLAAGSYVANLTFTNLNRKTVLTRQVTLAVVTKPVITSQPKDQAVGPDWPATFSVKIASNALVYYQWRRNATNLTDSGHIAGSTTTNLTIDRVSQADVGAYSVVLSNAAGVTVSSTAQLTIVPSVPLFSSQPMNQIALPGQTVALTVAVVGTQPFYYRWRCNKTNLMNGASVLNSTIFGASNATLIVSNISPANAGTYSVVVSNSLGAITNSGAIITVTSVTAPGIGLVRLYSFGAGEQDATSAPLLQGTDGSFYGTTFKGGTHGYGSIFRMKTNGTLTTLCSFSNTNGSGPLGGLLQARDGNLYGTTDSGGTNGTGTIFRMTTNGILTTLHSFLPGNGNDEPNVDGLNPRAKLLQARDGNLYGTTSQGGGRSAGTIFRITTNGVLTTLFNFDFQHGCYPQAGLMEGIDGNLYGTTDQGGEYDNNDGTIYRLTTNGVLTTLVSFDEFVNGAIPGARLVQDTNGVFYGTTFSGGMIYDYGTVFQMTPDGTLTTLYSFTGDRDGYCPAGGLVLTTDGNLYGTTSQGGTYDYGTFFSLARNGSLTTLANFDGYQGIGPNAPMVQGADGALYGTTTYGGPDYTGAVMSGYGAIYRLISSGPPQIIGQPLSQSAYVGANVELSVAVAGSLPLFYQWRDNGNKLTDGGNLSGTRTRMLTLTSVALANAGNYSVLVSNALGSVLSSNAIVTITLSAPIITLQPVDQTVLPGAPATFTVAAVGSQPLFYQWRLNSIPLAGATSTALMVGDVTPARTGNYSVVVSNSAGAVTSSNAVLDVVSVTAPGFGLERVYSFGPGEGTELLCPLVQTAEGSFFGTTWAGGTNNLGTIFRLATNGVLTTWVAFTNGNGAHPSYGGLIQGADGNLYGTTVSGGTNNYGTIFRMTPNGTLTTLVVFNGANGANPQAALLQARDGNFYGTTRSGGTNNYGTIFRMTPFGKLTTLVFCNEANGSYPSVGALIEGADRNLYGLMQGGGTSGYGVVYQMTTNGVMTAVASLTPATGGTDARGVVQDSQGNFYGTSYDGGTYGAGSVFKLTPDGTLATLYSFSQAPLGYNPFGGLLVDADGRIYGTTEYGGTYGCGTVFRIDLNGRLTFVANFDGYQGELPCASLIRGADGSLYGTTRYGGADYTSGDSGNGTIYRLFQTDTLVVQPADWLNASGNQGGSFSPSNKAYRLTSGTNLTWTVACAANWVTVAPAGGSLVAGLTNLVAVSFNANANTLGSGTHTAVLVFSNATSGIIQTRNVYLAISNDTLVVQPADGLFATGFQGGPFSPSNKVYVLTNSSGATLTWTAACASNWVTVAPAGGSLGAGRTNPVTVSFNSNAKTLGLGTYTAVVVFRNATSGVIQTRSVQLASLPTIPVFTAQPTNQTALPGQTIALTVVADGIQPLFYRWRCNGINLMDGANVLGSTIFDASTATLIVSNISPANAGTYSVVVSNSAGAVTSSGAIITVPSVTAPGVDLVRQYSFSGIDGKNPCSSLMQSADGNFYGTTEQGGLYGAGTVFRLTTNGMLTTLVSFNPNNRTNGVHPEVELVQARDGNLYGTTGGGGKYGSGTIFRMTTNGVLTTLVCFDPVNNPEFPNSSGAYPAAGLLQASDGNLYGTASQGGTYGYGTIFRMTTNGVLTTLVAFDHRHGAGPKSRLTEGMDGNLYGMTAAGGSNPLDYGTVFRVTTNGVLTTLFSFNGVNGAGPIGALVQDVDGVFYGATGKGGAYDGGTVFKMTPDGAFTTLYSFAGGGDGGNPVGGLIFRSDDNLYGTTETGGAYGCGTVFSISPIGALNTVANFDGYQGVNPYDSLIRGADGSLYGTTYYGGANYTAASQGTGAIFRLIFSGPPKIIGQPQPRSAYIGADVTLGVTACGSLPLLYHWRDNGTNLADGGNLRGAVTRSTLTFTNVTQANAGTYSVIVSNALGTAVSSNAILSIVSSGPILAQQPVSQTVPPDAQATFTVAALGNQPLFYQWRFNSVPLADATSSTLIVEDVTPARTGNYSVVVSNRLGAVTSSNAVLDLFPVTAPGFGLERLYSFGVGEGRRPCSPLVQTADGSLYGTTKFGGMYDLGTIFRLTTDGVLTTLVSFNGANGSSPSDGGMIEGADGNLYGTTYYGGTNRYGTVFRMTPNGTLTTLVVFNGANGGYPNAALLQARDGTFYGTTRVGGNTGWGTIFRMTPQGALTTLVNCDEQNGCNPDAAGLIEGADGNLYGMMSGGGPNRDGVIFRMTTNGVLTTVVALNIGTEGWKSGGMVLDQQGNLYGTSLYGGSFNEGSLYKVTPDGIFSWIYSFSGNSGVEDPRPTRPYGGLMLDADGKVYGTTEHGGPYIQGTVFSIMADGSPSYVANFDGYQGMQPCARLIRGADGSMYGTTQYGGRDFTGGYPYDNWGNGTIFRLFPMDALIVQPEAGLIAAGHLGGLFSPSNKVYVLTSGSNLAWTAACAANWVTIAPAGGTLQTGQTNLVTASLNANANTLGAGTHTAVVVFSNATSGIIQTRNVYLTIYPNSLAPLNHFVWTAIAPTQYVSQPFPVFITALDGSNCTCTAFTGTVVITAGNVALTPTHSGCFGNGVWTGAVAVLQVANNIRLLADDGAGHAGTGIVFSVVPMLIAPRGTPVWWLVKHGLTNSSWAAEELRDGDGDGYPAWQEYLAGTDPTNAQSSFHVLDFSVADGTPSLRFYGTTNSGLTMPFGMLRSTNLTVPSVLVDGNISRSHTGTNVWSDPSPISGGGAFYRPVATNGLVAP